MDRHGYPMYLGYKLSGLETQQKQGGNSIWKNNYVYLLRRLPKALSAASDQVTRSVIKGTGQSGEAGDESLVVPYQP